MIPQSTIVLSIFILGSFYPLRVSFITRNDLLVLDLLLISLNGIHLQLSYDNVSDIKNLFRNIFRILNVK